MNVNPVEWNQAQALLLKLVQTLAPLTQGFAPKHHPDMVPLDKRLFIPNLGENSSFSSFPYAVRLLTTLRSTQEQMHELMEKLPDEGLAKEEKEGVLSKKEGSVQDPERKVADPKSPLPNVRGEPRGAFINKEGTLSSKPPAPPSILASAQKLIIQVRDAIGALCTSMNLVDPRAAPLREALKRLKPLVDALISEVARGDMHSMDERQPQPFRFPLPSPHRAYLFKKEIPFPQAQPTVRGEGKKEMFSHEVFVEEGERSITKNRREKSLHLEGLSSSKTSPAAKPQQVIPRQEAAANHSLSHPKGEAEQEVKPSDPKVLPGVPFLSNSIQLQKKDKKKRKDLWSNNEQEQSKENT